MKKYDSEFVNFMLGDTVTKKALLGASADLSKMIVKWNKKSGILNYSGIGAKAGKLKRFLNKLEWLGRLNMDMFYKVKAMHDTLVSNALASDREELFIILFQGSGIPDLFFQLMLDRALLIDTVQNAGEGSDVHATNTAKRMWDDFGLMMMESIIGKQYSMREIFIDYSEIAVEDAMGVFVNMGFNPEEVALRVSNSAHDIISSQWFDMNKDAVIDIYDTMPHLISDFKNGVKIGLYVPVAKYLISEAEKFPESGKHTTLQFNAQPLGREKQH